LTDLEDELTADPIPVEVESTQKTGSTAGAVRGDGGSNLTAAAGGFGAADLLDDPSETLEDISMLAEERNEMLVEIREGIEIGNFKEAQSGQIEEMIDYSSMINNEFVPDEADQPPASPRYA